MSDAADVATLTTIVDIRVQRDTDADVVIDFMILCLTSRGCAAAATFIGERGLSRWTVDRCNRRTHGRIGVDVYASGIVVVAGAITSGLSVGTDQLAMTTRAGPPFRAYMATFSAVARVGIEIGTSDDLVVIAVKARLLTTRAQLSVLVGDLDTFTRLAGLV